MFKKYKNIIILIFFVILLIVLKITNIDIVKKISLINYDFYQKTLVKGEVKNITIIDIDEKSIAAIGQFPWRRDVYAKILSNLNQFNPASVAFDIFFSEEDKQNPKNLLIELKKNNNISENIEVLDTNKIFIDEIKKTKVILPVVGTIKQNLVINNSKPKLRIISKGSNPKNYLFKFNGKITSLEKINNAATGIGSISLLPGIDGIIRSVPILLNIDDQIWPSLSLESIRVSNGQKNLLIKANDSGIQSIKTRKNTFTTDNNGSLILNIKISKKIIIFQQLISLIMNFDKKRIENKIILIGSSAQGLFDIVKISNGRVVPGVEVHAHIIDNILTDDSIKKNLFTNSIENILLIIVLIMLILVPSKTKPKYSILFFIGCLITIT